MTDSFEEVKSTSLTEKMYELEEQVKEFGKQAQEVIETCWQIVRKINEVSELEIYFQEFPAAYLNLANCYASFVEFGCKMEILRNKNQNYILSLEKKAQSDFKLEIPSISVEEQREFSSENPDYSEGVHSRFKWQEVQSRKQKTPKKKKLQHESHSILQVPDKSVDLAVPSGSRSGYAQKEPLWSPPSAQFPVGKEEETIWYSPKQMKFNMEEGTVYPVTISHVVSPHEFYVFIHCNEFQLMKKLNEELARIGCISKYKTLTKKSADRSAVTKCGMYALAFSQEHGSWKRIKVLDWRPEKTDNSIYVKYIDNGCSSLIPIRETILMTKDLIKYPIFAQKCYLPGIVPVDADWSAEDLVSFKLLVETGDKVNEMKIEIKEIEKDGEDIAIGVELLLPTCSASVNKKLLEHVVALKGGKRMKNMSGQYLPPFKVGERIPVKITCISKANHIMCVLDYERLGKENVLEYLTNMLNNSPEQELSPLDKPPEVGEFVIAKYEDELWYRAQVIQWNKETNKWRIIFVDYGNTEKITMEDMRKMNEVHLKIPFQMIECFLAKVKLNRESDIQKGATFLHGKISEDVTIEIKKIVDETCNLYIVAIHEKSGINITQELVSAGYLTQVNK